MVRAAHQQCQFEPCPHAYNEDQLVERPATGLFAELDWQTVAALEETFGATGTLRRETKGAVKFSSLTDS